MIDLIPVAVALPDTAPAPAVIVVHGQGASKERWLGELSHYAAAGVIGVAVDARAHGSRAVDDIDTGGAIPVLDFLDIVDGTADDIAEVIDSLASMPGWNGRVAVWGFSMGAAIALLAAVRDPRVGAVALVGLPLLESDPDPADYPISDPDPEVLRELARRTAAGQLAVGIGVATGAVRPRVTRRRLPPGVRLVRSDGRHRCQGGDAGVQRRAPPTRRGARHRS